LSPSRVNLERGMTPGREVEGTGLAPSGARLVWFLHPRIAAGGAPFRGPFAARQGQGAVVQDPLRLHVFGTESARAKGQMASTMGAD
jgi:hypothetical protein